MESPRLLLTSLGLTNAYFQRAFLGMLRARKPSGGGKMLYIPDGLIGDGGDVHSALQGLQTTLSIIGAACQLECCELRRMNPQSLAQHLQGVDAIYVDCGNTFYLRYFMRSSGFDRLVHSLVRDGIIYVGVSSGSINAGQSITTAFWKGWDNPGYGEEWDLSRYGYDGLGLIPGGKSLFPHYLAWQHEQLVQHRRPSLGHNVVILSDDQAYVSDGRREYILTATGEVLNATCTQPQASKSFSFAAPHSTFGNSISAPLSQGLPRCSSRMICESPQSGRQQSLSPKSPSLPNAPNFGFGSLTFPQVALSEVYLSGSAGALRHSMPSAVFVTA
jgi:peptidase E